MRKRFVVLAVWETTNFEPLDCANLFIGDQIITPFNQFIHDRQDQISCKHGIKKKKQEARFEKAWHVNCKVAKYYISQKNLICVMLTSLRIM